MDIKLKSGETFNVKNSTGETVLSVGNATSDTVQEKLVSGTNIKTVNGSSILGSGNIETGTYSKPSNGIPASDLDYDAKPFEWVYTNNVGGGIQMAARLDSEGALPLDEDGNLICIRISGAAGATTYSYTESKAGAAQEYSVGQKVIVDEALREGFDEGVTISSIGNGSITLSSTLTYAAPVSSSILLPRSSAYCNRAMGDASFAAGRDCNAFGKSSIAVGVGTMTYNPGESAFGRWNKTNMDATVSSIGIGTADSARTNAVEVMHNGDVYIKGLGGYDGTNPTTAGVQDVAEVINGLSYRAFTNPVGPWCPDPCFWKGDDGYFYVKGTGRLVTVKRTRDFTSFEDTGRVFISEATMDAIFALYGHYATDDASYKLHPQYWAPFVIKIGQRWVLYLAIVEREGTKAAPAETTAHIMALTSRTPYGDFGDPVTIVSDGDYKLTNSVVWNNVIDPFVYCNPDDQKLYLVAGSSYSIGRLELTDDGLATVLPKGVGNKCARMAGLTISSDPNRTRVYEGSYIYRHVHNGTPYYYLFVSAGDYSTRDYCVCVGRCTTLNSVAGSTGYRTTDDNHDDMVSQQHYRRVILSTESPTSTFWGAGHVAGIIEGSDGREFMVYHCHTGNGTQDRQLFVQEIFWDADGWPYFGNNGHPVTSGTISKDIITDTTAVDDNILAGAKKIVVLTRAQYDAITNKDVNTLYFIK